MLRETIELLQTDDFLGVHEFIEIAKGKHKAPEGIKEGSTQILRQIQWELKR
jgi:hypothetical protein